MSSSVAEAEQMHTSADHAVLHLREAIIALQEAISQAEAGIVLEPSALDPAARNLRMALSFAETVRNDTRDELRRVCPKSKVLAEMRRGIDEPLDYGAVVEDEPVRPSAKARPKWQAHARRRRAR